MRAGLRGDTGRSKTDRIDDCVLALVRHDGQRVCKTFDWTAMERLHEKGLIADPMGGLNPSS
jgi:hypothetical protein